MTRLGGGVQVSRPGGLGGLQVGQPVSPRMQVESQPSLPGRNLSRHRKSIEASTRRCRYSPRRSGRRFVIKLYDPRTFRCWLSSLGRLKLILLANVLVQVAHTLAMAESL